MAKISLCMIVGNVEEYIERCLESFAPITDELCIVRAIGHQNGDKTMDIASEVCIRRGIPFRTAIYTNHEGHRDWPHIDDFAAARQMSYDLASGDWCFWADSDDILAKGASLIRKHAESSGFACYIFPYDIFGKNVVVPRERMMLKDSGRWKFPVHECYKFHVEPVTAAMDEGVVIQHLPRLDKQGGNQRNLRILESIPPEEMHMGLKYHLFGELIGAGRKKEAMELGISLLANNGSGDQPLGKDERYDLLMSMVLQTPDLEQQVTLMHEAHKVDPERREALGVLSCIMMDMGRPASALAYARQMVATLPPEVQSWNSRQSFYTYTGDEIFMQALRVNGKNAEAEAIRKKRLDDFGGPRIALLHATRGRPQQASKCRKAWFDLAAQPERIEHIFAFDDDDEDSKVLGRFHHTLMAPGGGCVAAWNACARVTAAPIVVQLSDDWVPVPKWDDIICERIGDVNVPRVLAIGDGSRTDKLLCMVICTRPYLTLDYFMFHPGFTGVYSDNWFTELAYARGMIVEARDIVFTHNHPYFGKAPMDKTYAEQNAPARYEQGQRVLERLHSGKDWSFIPGFFNYFEFYQVMAAQMKDGDVAVELGCWMGRSIIFLSQELKRLGKTKCRIIAVDTFKGETEQPEQLEIVSRNGGSIRKAFESNIARCEVADMIEIIEGDSAGSAIHIADRSVTFCFVDAAHDEKSVARDLDAWMPKIRPGGIIAGHDAQWEGVQKAVKAKIPKANFLGCIWVAPPA